MYNKIKHALVCSAIGDAIGYPVEFKTNIKPVDVQRALYQSNELVITDDTQMTLFGFEGLYNASHKMDIDAIRAAYVRWYHTQGETDTALNEEVYGGDGLFSLNLMHAAREPGNTCMSALGAISSGSPAVNDSKGCGAVMRLLPFVSLFGGDNKPGAVVDFAVETGLLTHQHAEVELAIRLYMEFAYTMLFTRRHDATLAMRVEQLAGDVHSIKHITELGTGWTALECVEMGIWAAASSYTLEECIIKSVAHDGDSDSVAAVACGLYGLLTGAASDPMTIAHNLRRIRERHIIFNMFPKIRGYEA